MEREELANVVKVMGLRPNDVIIIKCPVSISTATAERLRDEIRKNFGVDRKVYILSDGLDIEIVRPEA